MSEALLAEIAACPDDDAPRAVWADRLLEQGEPWGEFVQLQLAIARGGDAARALHGARVRELYEAHAARLEPAPAAGHAWVWRQLDQLCITPGAPLELAAETMTPGASAAHPRARGRELDRHPRHRISLGAASPLGARAACSARSSRRCPTSISSSRSGQ